MLIKFKRSLITTFVVIALAIITSMPIFCVNAAGTTFTMSKNNSVKAGEKFTLELSVSSNEGFAGFDFELHYSNTSLTLIAVEFSDKFDPDDLKGTSDSVNAIPYKLAFASSDNFTSNTVLAKFTFILASNAKLENHEVYITGNAVSADGKDLNPTFVKGGVVAVCSHDTNTGLWKLMNHTDATCTTPARTYYRCSECQQEKTEIGTELKPHEFKSHEHKDATCVENGYDKEICKNCQTVVTTKTYDATGHKFSEVTSVVPPTCVAQGYTVSKCTVCSEEVKSDFTDKIAHDMKESSRLEPTCQTIGYIRYTCSVCAHQDESMIPMAEHDYAPTEVVKPTHTNKGYTIYKCKYEKCTQSYNSDYTDMLPHTFEYTVVKEPTCTESGFKTGICTEGCNVTDDVEIPATGHTFKDWYVAVEATYTHDGYEERACAHCQLKETKLIPRLTDDLSKDDEPKTKLGKAIAYITNANHPAIIVISLMAVFISVICVAYIIIKIRKTR